MSLQIIQQDGCRNWFSVVFCASEPDALSQESVSWRVAAATRGVHVTLPASTTPAICLASLVMPAHGMLHVLGWHACRG